MLNKMSQDILRLISKLEGLPLKYIGRAGGLAWLGFGENIEYIGMRGEKRIAAKLSLHIQCSFRMVSNNKIFLTNLDMCEPANDTNNEDFNWDVQGANLFDKKASRLTEDFSSNSVKVSCATLSEFGDLFVELNNGWKLEIFNNTVDSEYDEAWRLFWTGKDEPHLVVRTNEVQFE